MLDNPRDMKMSVWTTVILCLVMTDPSWAAGKEKILHHFSYSNGAYPEGGLTFDSAGNLYGTASGGGSHGNYGVVFRLVPGQNSVWREQVLHNFNGHNGADPNAALILDGQGNLYGTTASGGDLKACDGIGCGVVFELTPETGPNWTERVLHIFRGKDGKLPNGLVFDSDGNLYGTTYAGGAYGNGCVFELSPGANGQWTESVLYSFGGEDGSNPAAGLIFDAAGNLYGTTVSGGASGVGTVFQLAAGAGGVWTEAVLHSFGPMDGVSPYAGLAFDPDGNLFGTTSIGGVYGMGTVFELVPGGAGNWAEAALYSFDRRDGDSPDANVTINGIGNLYGTTVGSGGDSFGVVFQLMEGVGGTWTENVLHRFKGGIDGAEPYAGVILDAAGNLYGTAIAGGASTECDGGCGIVYEITP